MKKKNVNEYKRKQKQGQKQDVDQKICVRERSICNRSSIYNLIFTLKNIYVLDRLKNLNDFYDSRINSLKRRMFWQKHIKEFQKRSKYF
jgi:hypothetical protein